MGMKLGFRSSPEKNGIPHIERVAPTAAIPGGEMTIHGRGFVSRAQARPVVRFGEAEAGIALASENRLVARVPEGRAEEWYGWPRASTKDRRIRYTYTCKSRTNIIH